jgi:transposase-like protein
MGQMLHGSATTTHAVRAAIQRSEATTKELAGRYGLNPKTVAKWKKRGFVHDAAMGPKEPRSTILTPEEEAMAVAFRVIRCCRSMIVSMHCKPRFRI